MLRNIDLQNLLMLAKNYVIVNNKDMESLKGNQDLDLNQLIESFSELNDVIFVENNLRPEVFPEYTERLRLFTCFVREKIRPDLDVQKIDEYVSIDGFLEMSGIEGQPDDAAGYPHAVALIVGKIVEEFGIDNEEATTAMRSYESLENIEARYVKGMKEIIILLAHIENGGQQMGEVARINGLFQPGVRKLYDDKTPDLNKYLYDLPEIMDLREKLIDKILEITTFPVPEVKLGPN